jgi:ATP-dependent RNA helicase HelY
VSGIFLRLGVVGLVQVAEAEWREVRSAFVDALGFAPDRFQVEAFDAFDAGCHVVVSAPTGSGKTVVAEYAVARAVASGKRAFYTAPLKALSNQKFRDLTSIHGPGSVGLLTGDVAISGDASVVVMTTEVLRNMIYAGSSALDDLAVVVLDEVHYLQDAYRGPVWEEVIIHLPSHVRLVCLSATVGNAAQLADWMETVRGPTGVIVEHTRPVELLDHHLVADRTEGQLRLLPTFVDGSPNRDAVRLDEAGAAARWRGRGHARRGAGPSGARRLATPGRVETVELLRDRSMLPAIVFIFSRNQCSEAASTCLAAGMSLIDDDARDRIRELLDEHLGAMSPADLEALGVVDFEAQLLAGVAPHHAGLVPPFKEVVERCFAEGLLAVVFATETLAVGVNMPARTVVIERITKYNGDHHVTLTPAEFTQLTGRAGRRGIDTLGHAVVLWSPFVRFEQVAALASSRSFDLRSVFRPTYNMVANLIRRHDRASSRELMTMSFAQFQRDSEVVRLQTQLVRRRERLHEARERSQSPFGDIDEYRLSHGNRPETNSVDEALALLRPGQVVFAQLGPYRGPVAVVATANRAGGLRLSVVTAAGRLGTLAARDFDDPPVVVGEVELPGQYSPHRRDFRAEVSRRLKRAKLRQAGVRHRGERSAQRREIHPVSDDPDLRSRIRAAEEADRRSAEVSELEARIDKHQSSLGHDFDSVVSLLDDMGLVDSGRWELTDEGLMLAGLFHECDLLVVEAIRRGLFDGLDPSEVAGLASAVVYEYRGPDDPPPAFMPTTELRRRIASLEGLSSELTEMERAHGLATHRSPDAGFVAAAHAWCSGADLGDVVGAEEMAGGDVVRNLRQVIDLCQQIGSVAPNSATRRSAQQAVDAATRGIIRSSAVVSGEGAG